MKLEELTECHQALSSQRLTCRKKMSHVSLHSSLSKSELKNLSKLLSGRKEAGNSHSRVTSSQVFNYWVYSSVQPLKTVSENKLQGWDSNFAFPHESLDKANSVKFEIGRNLQHVLSLLHWHKPLLLSTWPGVLILTRLRASVGVTHSYSSRPFLCALVCKIVILISCTK